MTDPNRQLGLDELAASYGYAASFFNSDSELRALIDQAVREQWTADRFRAGFMNTDWYRTKSADVRQWTELEIRDPATAEERITNQKFSIQAMANQMGISLDAGRLKKMARDSLLFGWEENQLKQAVAAEFKYTGPGSTTGGAASLEDRIRQYGADFGVSLTNDQVGQWIGGALAGTYTEDTLRDYARDMARSKYPGMQYYLDQGMTVRQVAQPYVKSFADILEVGEDDIDLGDSRIQTALQGTQSQGAGKAPVMQTLYEFEKSLRKDTRWLQTKNGRSSVQDATIGVLRDFGLVG